jgi:hypothetical protein
MPALSLGQAGPYVAGAYLAFLGLILVYVTIMAGRLSRLERELERLAALARRVGGEPPEEETGP